MKWFWIILIEMVVYLTILNIVKIVGVSIGSAFCLGYLTSGLVFPTVKMVFQIEIKNTLLTNDKKYDIIYIANGSSRL